jgi:hypothetical protein
MNISKPIRYTLIIVGILIGLLFFWFYHTLNPSEHSVYPECQFYASTGYLCPGCGSQRAVHDILHFNITEAFKHNALVGLSILALVYLVFVLAFNKISSKKIPNYFNRASTAYAILGIILIFWILRNLPFEVFNILRP